MAPNGATSAAKTFTISNIRPGAGTVTFSPPISVSGNFAIASDGCSGAPLLPNGSCTVIVTFTPTALGAQTGTLTAVDNSFNSPQTASLSGTGVAGTLTFSPASLAFGSQGVGIPSAAKTITLTNSSAVPMSITSIAGTTDFTTQNDLCSGTNLAAPGGTCTVQVVFNPTVTGALTEYLAVTDQGAGSPQMVTLTGTGQILSATVAPASLAFGNQEVGVSSADKFVTLTNPNAVAMIFGQATVSANYAIDTSTFMDTCSNNSIGPGLSCTIPIIFTPATTGTLNGTLRLPSNATNSPQSVTLTGKGILIVPTFSPSPLAFGKVTEGNANRNTVTFTNPNRVPLPFASAVATGTTTSDYSIASGNDLCSGTDVAANGGTCTIAVTFSPSVTGVDNGKLTVTTSAVTPTSTVTLTGTGEAP